jgi:hypothetical protein
VTAADTGDESLAAWRYVHVRAFAANAVHALAAAVVCVGVAGCSGNESGQGNVEALDVDVELIRGPRGGIIDIPVRLSFAERVVVTYVPPGGDPTPAWRNHLYWFDLEQRQLEQLPLPARRDCRATSHDSARALPDGRVAYLEECWGQDVPRDAKRLRAYDPRTGEVSDLRPYALPVGSSHYAFDPTGRRAIINDGNGLYERLHWLGGARLVALDLEFERAGYPAWSHDGRSIAVDAVPPRAKASGVSRADLPRDLYLLGRDGSIRRKLLRDLSSVGASSWSPDNRWLALPLDPRDGPAGLYLVDTASGVLRLLRTGEDFGGSVWLDRRTLLVATGLFVQIARDGRSSGLYRIEIRDP